MTEWLANAAESFLSFSDVLNASISASWMVLAVILFRLVFKNAPKWSRVLLWGLVAVRLLLPFSIESELSLVPSAETVPQEVMRYEGTQLDEPAHIDVIKNPAFSDDISIELGETAEHMQISIINMTFVWLSGIAVLLLYTIISYLSLRHKVNTAVLYKDNIFQSENVGSPFVLGIIKPRIYLPFKIDIQDLEHVVAHEQAHIKRKDHWWKPLGFVLLSIHWFNPVMWLAYILLCRDIELACDEKVIKELNNEQRADYTQALVSCSVNRRMIAACPLAFGEIGVKERVKSVLNYKKPAFWMILMAMIACVVVAICFLTDPVNENNSTDEGYYLVVGADGVKEIRVSTPDGGGGTVKADESLFKKGEEVYIEQLQNVNDLRGVSITAVDRDGRIVFSFSFPENAFDTAITNAVSEDGWLIAPVGFKNITKAGEEIWSRRDAMNPTEMLDYLCKEAVWNDAIEATPHISIPGNFGPHAHFEDVVENADALDAAMARRAFLLMRLYPKEVFYVTWSYPAADGMDIRRELHADEMSAILSLSSNGEVYKTPDSAEAVELLIQFLTVDSKMLIRYSEEGNDLSPLHQAQKNAVWFTPEDIYDIEYIELVRGEERFVPLTQEGYEYIEERFAEADELTSASCLFNGVLYIHRADGVVGKVMPAEDSCDVFMSDGKYYQYGNRDVPPYSDSSDTFYRHFAILMLSYPEYEERPDSIRNLTDEEIEEFHEMFSPLVYDKRGDIIGINPWSCFFTSYYTDVRHMDFAKFLAYFPGDETTVSDEEFELLKQQANFPFKNVSKLSDMPVPVHRYPVRIVDLILGEYAGISVDDLDTSNVNYLGEYDAFYNYTSDAGHGTFVCSSGEVEGNIIRLYEYSEYETDVLTLSNDNGNYKVISHLRVKN